MPNLAPNLTLDLEEKLLAVVEKLADTARDIAQGLFRSQDIGLQDKDDLSPVTLADKRIELAWRDIIEKEFPNHGIVGEEFDEKTAESNVTWVLDPIDGTRQFVMGMPLFGSLIGVLVDGQPVIGCLEAPIMGERWIASPGSGSRLNGKTVKTSITDRLTTARLMSTAPAMFAGETRERFSRLSNLCKDVRFGTDCYAYGLLALGHCDLVAEADMKPMDIMPLIPVVERAGGVVSDWHGQACTLTGNGTILASASPELHAQALAAFRL